MHDMRNAAETVALFRDHIGRLRRDEKSYTKLSPSSSASVQRAGSDGSNGSGSRKSSSKIDKGVGKDWRSSPTGAIWHSISAMIEEVAAEQDINRTVLKEFVSSREVLDLGTDFVRRYRDLHLVHEKPKWVAEELFFELQTVKHGDKPASKFTQARKPDWNLADYLARFVLLADGFRRRADREDWNVLAGRSFAQDTCVYLGILRCFTMRDAQQRGARERELGLLPQLLPLPQQSQQQQSPPPPPPPQQKEKEEKAKTNRLSWSSISRHSSGKAGSTKS